MVRPAVSSHAPRLVPRVDGHLSAHGGVQRLSAPLVAACPAPPSQGMLEAVDRDAVRKGAKGKVRRARARRAARGPPCLAAPRPAAGQARRGHALVDASRPLPARQPQPWPLIRIPPSCVAAIARCGLPPSCYRPPCATVARWRELCTCAILHPCHTPPYLPLAPTPLSTPVTPLHTCLAQGYWE
mgnify:CR=1 FL=1